MRKGAGPAARDADAATDATQTPTAALACAERCGNSTRANPTATHAPAAASARAVLAVPSPPLPCHAPFCSTPWRQALRPSAPRATPSSATAAGSRWSSPFPSRCGPYLPYIWVLRTALYCNRARLAARCVLLLPVLQGEHSGRACRVFSCPPLIAPAFSFAWPDFSLTPLPNPLALPDSPPLLDPGHR